MDNLTDKQAPIVPIKPNRATKKTGNRTCRIPVGLRPLAIGGEERVQAVNNLNAVIVPILIIQKNKINQSELS